MNQNRFVVDKKLFTPRAVLRTNLKALMAKALREGNPDLGRQIRLGKKARVGQATIGRILSDEGEDSGVETVAKLAGAFGLEPWQLMVPGMDPGNPPVLQPVTKAEKELYRRLKEAADEISKLR